MAILNQIELPDGVIYDIPCIYTVKGTQTSSTASWTGNIAVDALYDGLVIAYYLPVASKSGTNVTLNLTLKDGTTTGAVAVYVTGETRLTTHYGVGSTIYLTYWSAGSISISGTPTTAARWSGSDYYISKTDTKVRQTLVTGDANRPLLLSYSDNTVTTSNVDNVCYRNNSIYANPSSGIITATGFAGNLTGNADTATTAGNVTGTVAIANGGTGATSASAALTNLGAAASGHTHTTTIATSTGTNQITLAHGGKYALTAGGTSYIFTMPALDSSAVTTALGFTPYDSTNPSGYTSNTGTITSVKTTAGTHSTINVTTGAAEFNVPTKTSHLTNDSGFLTSHQTIKQDGVTGATVNRFGTCSVAAGTAAKTVSITTGTFSLEAGARVTVKFSNANTASNPTLNVASTGGKNIFHRGAQITSGANKGLLAGVVEFIYDGTQYHLLGDTWYAASTTSIGSASAGTAISADDITAWTTNTPTVVTPNTVVTGGTKTSIPNISKKTVVTGVTKKTVVTGCTPATVVTGCTPATVVTSASGATASVSGCTLTITDGSFSTGASATVTTGASATVTTGDSCTVSTGDSVTVGTAIEAYTSLTTGAACTVTDGVAASLSYTSRSIPNISVTSTTVATGISGS